MQQALQPRASAVGRIILACALCAAAALFSLSAMTDTVSAAPQGAYPLQNPDSVPSASPPLPPMAPAPIQQPVVGSATSAAAPGGGSVMPSLPNVEFSWSGYFGALAVLIFFLAAVWALLWFVKRLTRGGGRLFSSSAPGMRIENRLALGPQKWLLVVLFMDRRLVLGVTERNITLLTEMPLHKETALQKSIGQDDAESIPGGPDIASTNTSRAPSFASFFDKPKDDFSA